MSRSWVERAAPLLLVLITLLVWRPALDLGFIWDDDDYVINNRAVHSPGSLRAIWLAHETPQYYPIVFTTFWLEHHVWGLDARGYHAVNVALHALNVLLLWAVVRRFVPRLAFATALLFAVHPIQVETVAWVTERKNLLALGLFLATTLLHLRDRVRPSAAGLAATLVAFVLALLSKSVAVCWVIVPPLITWWRGERFARRQLVRLAPFVVIGLAAGLQTILLEVHHVGARGAEWQLGVAERLLLPGKIVWFYIAKTVRPLELTFVYPRFVLEPRSLVAWLPTVLLGSGLAALWLLRERLGRGPFAVTFFYVASLGPALGFFNVYPMRYSFVADHFTYLSISALLLLMVATVDRLLSSAPGPLRSAGPILLIGVTIALTLGTRAYLPVYRSLESLWNDVVTKNPQAWMAHSNLGLAFLKEGRLDEAERAFERALTIRPELIEPRLNLALSYQRAGATQRALAIYRDGLEIDPDHASLLNNLGNLYLTLGRGDEAVAAYTRAVASNPRHAIAHHNLGQAERRLGRPRKAIAHLEDALRIDEHYANAWNEIGLAHQELGQPIEARSAFERAVEVDASYGGAHVNLGKLAESEGDVDRAMASYFAALRAEPEQPAAHYNLALLHLRHGDKSRADEHLRRARAAGFELPPELDRALGPDPP